MDSPLKFNEEKGKKRKAETEKSNGSKMAESFTSDFPFFKMCMKKNNVEKGFLLVSIQPLHLSLSLSPLSIFDYISKIYKMGLLFIHFMQRVPASFAKEHLPPQGTTKIVLRNSEGKCWGVNYVNNGKSKVLSKGLKEFVRENKLKIDDICIFELVAKKKIRVHFFR
jgi:hypothetical protein